MAGGATTEWLSVTRGEAPLLLSIPHAGVKIPDELPVPYDEAHSAPMRTVLTRILDVCSTFAMRYNEQNSSAPSNG